MVKTPETNFSASYDEWLGSAYTSGKGGTKKIAVRKPTSLFAQGKIHFAIFLNVHNSL